MTQQDRQFKKVKKYRTLKVVFYCLGLPLFLVAVFFSAFRFIGNDPFTGTTEVTTKLGFFVDIEKLFTSPALYGVWIAFAIWAVIAIVHIILSKTVRNRRTRMFSMMAVTLAVMMGTMFGMDAALGANIETMAKEAPAGVTVADYKTQLSYYRTISSYRHSMNMTEKLIEQVELLEKVYNVQMEGVDKSGASGNIGNKPITYRYVIDDEGNEGVDISYKPDPDTGFPVLDYDPSKGNLFAGNGEINDTVENRIIELAPNAAGNLVINGKVYTHYFYTERKNTKGDSLYTWYAKDLLPIGSTWDGGASQVNTTDGIYGKGIYNTSGLLSDGWVLSLDNALRILEDYYESKDAIESGASQYYANYYVEMYTDAAARRDAYYNGETPDSNGNYVDPWLTALYNQEIRMTERFSLTRGELDELLAKVGALLGDNKLFDYLFINLDNVIDGLGLKDTVSSFLGGALGELFVQLNNGLSLSKFGLTGNTLKTVIDIIKPLTDNDDMIIDDLYLTVAYKAKDCFGREQDHLYIGLVRGEGNWFIKGTETQIAQIVRKQVTETDENGKTTKSWKWVYQNVDGTEFIPTVKTYDSREVELVEDVWTYKDGSGAVTIDNFKPVSRYFIDKDVEVTKDENGNWVFADDTSDIIGGDYAPVEKFFADSEVVKLGSKWVYAYDNTKEVAGEGFVPSEKYFDVFGGELTVNAAGDKMFNADRTQFPVVKIVETVDEQQIEKWVYEGVDGTEFAAVEKDEKQFDMFGNEIEFITHICTDFENDTILDIDFDDALIDEDEGLYAFDFDTLSEFLNTGLNNLLEKYAGDYLDTINTVIGVVKTLGILKDIDVDGESYTGLVISGIQIPLLNSDGKVDIDIEGILEGLLSGMYSYQSSVIKPVWEFYEHPYYAYQRDENGSIVRDENGRPVYQRDENGNLVIDPNNQYNKTYYVAQMNYANYERALYMATVQGAMMGSTLIGDNLGAGTYPSSFGLADLASVRQLLSDLSYQPVYFPLYALRDMLAFFTGIVILFYFASFLMAQKEEDYATGKIKARSRKDKNENEATVIAEFDAFELENAENGTDVDEKPVSEDGEFEEEPVKEKKSLFGKKNKKKDEDLELENFDEPSADNLDAVEEEPVKEKKSLFGKKNKKKDEEPEFENFDEPSADNLDAVEEEPVKEKKSLFGKKNKKKDEELEFESFDEPSADTLEAVEEEPVKEKKSLFGKKNKKKDEELEFENFDEPAAADDFGAVDEEPVKVKKSLFGKKKKQKDDLLEEETALPVSENSDEEVL